MSLPLPEQPSRNRSASTGDSGLPQHEHKRPRLSEGPGLSEKTTTTMTTHNIEDTSSSTKTSATPPPLDLHAAKRALVSAPQSPLPTADTPDATSPHSKVTINTRPISSQSSNIIIQPEVVSSKIDTGAMDGSDPSRSDRPIPPIHDEHPETISISSSDGGSPIIQVAAPEDLDQDPTETKWEPLLKSNLSHHSPIRSGHVQNTFPYADHDTSAYTLIPTIARHWAEGDLSQDEVFIRTKTWLIDFANQANNLDYNFFEEDREFWLKLPTIIGSFIKRERPIPTTFDANELVDIFTAFARISILLLDADIHKLKSYSELTDSKNIVIPRCLPYVAQLTWILSSDGIPLYDTVHESLGIEPRLITQKITDRLLQSHPERYIRSVTVLFQLMADQFPRRASLIDSAFNLAQQSSFFISILAMRVDSSLHLEKANDHLMKLFSASSDFLHSINAVLDRAITKQQPWLNIETCDRTIRAICVFVERLVTVFPHLASDLVSAANVLASDIHDGEMASVASPAWKFVTLQKIIKKGRMEVRVACVQLMASDLLDTYNVYIRPAGKAALQSRIDFYTSFIRRNDLIRYLIGVDSHPQIIERCFNIIGFLCHTCTYMREDTDVIWHAVAESQDPRTVTAILFVVQQSLETLSSEMLCYIAKRLLELPYDRVDFAMLDFSLQLIHIANQKFTTDVITRQEETEINDCTMSFCFKMLREANTPTRIRSELSGRVRHHVHSILSQKMKLMRSSFSPSDHITCIKDMIKQSCEHIRVHDEFASGSTLLLSTILVDADFDECSSTVQEHDLAALAIDDVLYACDVVQNTGLRDYTELEFENRFRLLTTIVMYSSSAITGHFIEQLWTKLLSSSELDQRIRYMAWSGLGNVFDLCRERNTALDVIVHKHLPTLSPTLYDSAIFNFVKESVKYEMRHSPVDLTESQDTIAVPGIDRVWTIMLSAPMNTVELHALQFIIEQYLDGDRILKCDSARVEATHLALIDRSVSQVIEAAYHLKEVREVDDSGGKTSLTEDSHPAFHETRFHRSLLFLRKFLDSLKTRPRYTPAVNEDFKRTLSTFEKRGQIFEVTLQILGHKTLTSAQLKWMLGCDNTASEIWHFLSELTGWSQFIVINGGKRVPLKEDDTKIQDVGIKTGSFMVSKVPGSPENMPTRLLRATSPVDSKVMHHFEELYSLLDLEDLYAKEVFDFLSIFPTQPEVVQKLKSMATSADELLPIGRPFKLMYYARALRSCMEDESFSSDPDTEFLSYGIKVILTVLGKLTQVKAELRTHIIIAQNLIEVLILGFRARVPADVSLSYIENGPQFCRDLVALWKRAIVVGESDLNQPGVASFTRAPFEALIEGLLHDNRLWPHLMKDDFLQCLERCLLFHSLPDVRQAVLEVFHGLTGVSNYKIAAKISVSRAPRARFALISIDVCLKHLWGFIVPMLYRADSASTTCEEFFEAAVCIFQQLKSKLSEDDLLDYIEDWKTLILKHQHKQQIGLPLRDYFMASLGKLFLLAIKAVQSIERIADPKTFIGDLFSSFLFPPLSDDLSFDADMDSILQEQCDPILDMQTRSVLYEIVLALSHDQASVESVCQELSSDQIPKDFYFPVHTNNDRQALRSEAGYAGLRNLSNTCYLNSLISQLFMNVEFRELVMNVNIIDHSKQKLVAELGKVFAYMQNSYEDAISPECAIDAITLWDGEQIDVTVQMDVDEFFNLLFDRLESQIVDPKVCNAFKGIYGGQLVQQIKSKECEHVSERLEPFAAVQVEIKGKTTLEESLRAYVEGEVLQGENKYSCTGCGKHVDAVKRACLKTVPDHLIFNLKRFDYDIMTGTRCKINDEFGFPETIDMAPYTLEALTHPESHAKPDIFELVGIIVHSGTAESGHYYSYIRERPSSASKAKSWLQFNDNDVTQFDPTSIRECCFGGIDFGAIQCAKFYNGYMLFYQRASSIENFKTKYSIASVPGRVRVPTASELDLHIIQQNEIFLRTYVAQDPTHAKFIRHLLHRVHTDESLRCRDTQSDRSHNEAMRRLIPLSLNYLQRVSARWKDLPEVEETLKLLSQCATACPLCARQILVWLMQPSNLADNLVRSCYLTVRKEFAFLIVNCWTYWSTDFKKDMSTRPEESEDSVQLYRKAVNRFLAVMVEAWDHLQRHGRSWDQYFGILSVFVSFGHVEARAVIESGLLQLCLELIHVHVPPFLPKSLRIKYNAYLAQRERNRIFNHGVVVRLLAEILPYVDFHLPITTSRDRPVVKDRVGVSPEEAALLGLDQQEKSVEWLRKIIQGRSSPSTVLTIITHLSEAEVFDTALCDMLKETLADRHIPHAVIALEPTLAFVANCSTKPLVVQLITEALTLIESTDGQYAREFLTFVQSLLSINNPEFPALPSSFRLIVKKQIPDWAPALLTASNDIDSDIRTETLDILNEVLFNDMKDSTSEQHRSSRQRLEVNICKSLVKSLADYVETNFVNAQGVSLQGGQAYQANKVAFNCLRYFDESASDEEKVAQITAIMDEFKAKAAEFMDTATDADWNASSDLEGVSEADNMSDTSN